MKIPRPGAWCTRPMKQTPIRRTHITHIIIVIAFQFPINNSPSRAKCDLLTRISGGELAGTGGADICHLRDLCWCAAVCSLMLQNLQTGDTAEYKVSGDQITSPYNLQLYCSSLWLDIQHLQLIKTKVSANILNRRIITTGLSAH